MIKFIPCRFPLFTGCRAETTPWQRLVTYLKLLIVYVSYYS